MTDEIGRREFIKRSTVAGVIATTGLPAATVTRAATPPTPTRGAVTPDTSASDAVLATRHLDSKEFCLSEYDALRPALSFSATDGASAARWQRRARKRLIERLGGGEQQRFKKP